MRRSATVVARIGKPVESTLWFAALRTAALRRTLRRRSHPTTRRSRGARWAMRSKFWNADRGCCYGVLDGPDGNDPSIRLTRSSSSRWRGVTVTKTRAVVDVCVRLLTPVGLRTLAPTDARRKDAGGDPDRGSAYHQGRSGHGCSRSYKPPQRLRRSGARAHGVAPLADALDATESGEIFDGDAPHAPTGRSRKRGASPNLSRRCGLLIERAVRSVTLARVRLRVLLRRLSKRRLRSGCRGVDIVAEARRPGLCSTVKPG